MIAKPVDVELAPLIEGAVETARKVAEAKKLEFHANYDAGRDGPAGSGPHPLGDREPRRQRGQVHGRGSRW